MLKDYICNLVRNRCRRYGCIKLLNKLLQLNQVMFENLWVEIFVIKRIKFGDGGIGL